MAEANFNFNSYPYRYIARFTGEDWLEEIEELRHLSPEEEKDLSLEDLNILLAERNAGSSLPLVNYTTQYGLGCFEGLKAYPQKNGSLALFRVDANAQRFYNSMQGLYMPPFLKEKFVDGVISILKNSAREGFRPQYNSEWEQDNFSSALGVYVRPFTYSEGGFGVNLSKYPRVIIVASEVGSYFNPDAIPSIVVSDRIRATPNGTGWIKAASNYVISTIAKNVAISEGYTECLFLDAKEQKYVEEGSSCNIFFVLKNGTVVTPALGDTILPGITRDSVITLLTDKQIVVEERSISIEEVFDSAVECFTTGTAVGVSYFGTLSHNGREKTFADGGIGKIAQELLFELKHIQYGLQPDPHNWITVVE